MSLNALLPRPRRLPFGALLPLLLLATGCSGRGDVAGKVSLDGKPLPAGTIIFQSGKRAVSADIKDGEYTATGVPAGDVKVAVETGSIKAKAEMLGAGVKMTGKEAGPQAQKAKELLAKYLHIPERYADPNKSGLTAKVNSGSNQKNFDLTSK
jgi:hypothetical protein